MSLNAFVTLVTTDSYVPGALVAIHSVLEKEGRQPAHPFETVCLVTPATVSVQSIKALRHNFSLVVGVEEIRSGSNRELALLGESNSKDVSRRQDCGTPCKRRGEVTFGSPAYL